jgi:hypothetical protein
MIFNYSKFINCDLIKEGSITNRSVIYWNHQIEKLLTEDWTEIGISNFAGKKKYFINFKAGPDKYDYYSVVMEKTNEKDLYYLEDNDNNVTEKFIKKFKEEFWKNASEYVKNLDYKPKCLGDLSHVIDAEKYNL